MGSIATNGSNTGNDVAGRIGERIASRFRIFLDYSHHRIILEPVAGVSMDGSRAVFGAAIVAEGSHFGVFRVTDVAEHSAAENAGLKEGDVISTIDGRPSSVWTLTALLDALEQTETHHLIVVRDKEEVKMDVAARNF